MRTRLVGVGVALVAVVLVGWATRQARAAGPHQSGFDFAGYPRSMGPSGLHLSVPLGHGYSFGLEYGQPSYRRGHYDGYRRGHYDYYPGSYEPHGNHFDYLPGHYDYHQGGHNDYHGGGYSHYRGH